MRLWHKDLITCLPRQQLLGQWRECCLIAKNIAEQGTPNHLLVNKIMNYPIEHFYSYAKWIEYEMKSRGYKCDFDKFEKWYGKIFINPFICYEKTGNEYVWRQCDVIFPDWHNLRYLEQCFYNLQEKFDCGGITKFEWVKINSQYHLSRIKYAGQVFNDTAKVLLQYSDKIKKAAENEIESECEENG